MKNLLKAFAAEILALLARGVVSRYKPRILMVTGSVGKTSTKDAIAAVLDRRFFVRASKKNFNSEIGVPLTIFGIEDPWKHYELSNKLVKNTVAWSKILKRAFALLLLPNHYPNFLVLEVGADRPGDLARILRIATPDVVVVTHLPDVPVHVEAYANPSAVREEEFSPAYALKTDAPLILSADDAHALTLARQVPAKQVTYGKAANANVHIGSAKCYLEEGRVVGMTTHVTVGGEEGEIIVRGAVGGQQVRPAAAAIAVAGLYGMSLREALTALGGYEPPPGRGRLLEGKNGSTLIDDSYNSSPAAVEKALLTLKVFHGAKRRIAVLGDMLELGRYSVAEHEKIGASVPGTADILVAVGIRARRIADAATAAGMRAEQVFSYDTCDLAAMKVLELAQEGDVILIKGSQSVRTERIVEAVLRNPEDKAKLVRQEREWKRR